MLSGLMIALTAVWLSSSGAVEAATANLSGQYSGSWQSNDGDGGGLFLDITQVGTTVTGMMTLSNSACGYQADVTGTVSGNTINGTFALGGPNRGQFTLKLSGTQLDGTYRLTAGCYAGDTGTFSLTALPTPTATVAATLTPTATVPPTSTVAPTATPTPTPTPGPPTSTPTLGPCVGDCDHSGTLTVDELVKGVNIALGNLTLDQCPMFDCNATQKVTVDCLVKAVNGALNGCLNP